MRVKTGDPPPKTSLGLGLYIPLPARDCPTPLPATAKPHRAKRNTFCYLAVYFLKTLFRSQTTSTIPHHPPWARITPFL